MPVRTFRVLSRVATGVSAAVLVAATVVVVDVIRLTALPLVPQGSRGAVVLLAYLAACGYLLALGVWREAATRRRPLCGEFAPRGGANLPRCPSGGRLRRTIRVGDARQPARPPDDGARENRPWERPVGTPRGNRPHARPAVPTLLGSQGRSRGWACHRGATACRATAPL